MPVPFIGGILAVLGAAVPAVIAAGTFLGELVASFFKIFEGHRSLLVFFFWTILFVDTFVIGTFTTQFLNSIGINNVTINFTTFFLLIPNVFLSFIFGIALTSFHVLIVLTFWLIMEFAFFLSKMAK